MANQGCIEHIHKMRNVLSEMYMRLGLKGEKIELMDLDKIKHELEKMWITCLGCSKGEICGKGDE